METNVLPHLHKVFATVERQSEEGLEAKRAGLFVA